MNRQEALEKLSKLSPEIIEAMAMVIETADAQGDYASMNDDGCGSFWEDDVNKTLSALSEEIRNLKSIEPDNTIYIVTENHPDREILGIYKSKENAEWLVEYEKKRLNINNPAYISTHELLG